MLASMDRLIGLSGRPRISLYKVRIRTQRGTRVGALRSIFQEREIMN